MNIREFVDSRARNSFKDDICPFCVIAVAQMDYYDVALTYEYAMVRRKDDYNNTMTYIVAFISMDGI